MKRLSTWLIIIGILVAAIPLVGRLYMNYQQDKMYRDYLTQMEGLPSMDIMDEKFADDITTDEAVKAGNIKPRVIENVIGRIAISAISSDQLLLEGSSSKEMRFGAGHVIGSAMPGEVGNCAISAHRNYTFGTYFTRLGEVQKGDLVKITYNGNTYTYSVNEILVVLPSDVSVLKTTKIPTVTLITCHPKGSNTHRLIVKGVLLVDGKPVTEKNDAASGGALEAPADSVKAPADSVKAPADSVKAPADSVEAPADSTETPADSTGTPGDNGTTHDDPAETL